MDISTAIGVPGMGFILAFQYMVAIVISVVTYPYCPATHDRSPQVFLFEYGNKCG